MDAEFLKMLAETIKSGISASLQRASYELGDMLNRQDPVDHVLYLAQMQNLLNATLPRLSAPERKIFDFVVDHSETVIMPTEFDPRKKKE